MKRIVIGVLSTLLIIFIIPIIVYGIFSFSLGLKEPAGISAIEFLFSVFISKIGTAITFTLIYFYSKDFYKEKWVLYSFIWWLLFLFGEIGQAFGPNYSYMEAVAGILSEAIYLPLSTLLLRRIIK